MSNRLYSKPNNEVPSLEKEKRLVKRIGFALLALWVGAFLLTVSGIGLVIYVICHFIMKFW